MTTSTGSEEGDRRLIEGCYPCREQALPERRPWQEVLQTPHWRAAHAFNSTLPGWLVLVPTSHVTAVADLSADAAAELGTLIHRLSRALHEVTGCVKTYVMQFAEADGFSHLHVHLVPRAADLPATLKGPAIFGYLTDDEGDALSQDERDALAGRLQQVLAR